MKNSILARLFAPLHRLAGSSRAILIMGALVGAFTTTATAAIATLGTQSSQYSTASTLSFTVGAGTDRLLVVALGDPNTVTNPTAVSYNSTPMLQANATADLGFSNDAIWYLKLGTGGAINANVVVTFATAGNGTSKRFIGASAYSGVDQTTPVDTNGPKITGAHTGTNLGSSLDVTSQTGDLVFDLFDSFLTPSQTTFTTGAGQTLINDAGGSVTPSGGFGHYTTSTEAGASTVTMSWTSNAGAVLHLTMNINAAAAPPPTTVTSLNRVNTTPSNASFVNWTLTFASPVTGLTASNFTLSGAAATGSAVVSPGTSDGGLTWNVPVFTGSTDGTLTLSLANATGLTPGVSTSLPFTTAGQTYTMDKTRPTVTVAAPSVSTIAAGAGSVTYAVTYADANFASSSLTTGGITLNKTGTADGTVGLTGSGTSYTVTISSITGVGTLGITVGANTSLDTATNANLASSASTTFAVTASGGGTVVLTHTSSNTGAVPVSRYGETSHTGEGLLAQCFTTGSTATTLTKVTLNLGASSGTINGSSQPIVVSIYNETTGTAYRNQTASPYVTSANVPQPGSQVAGGLLTPVNPRPTVAGAYDFTGSVALAANTSYWIVVSSADASGAYNWLYDNNDGAATSPSGWSVRALNSNSAMNLVDTTRQGINIWDNFDGFNYLFSITASAAAPTPTITVNPTSVALGTTTTGTAGTAQSFTVSGSNLTADIVLTAPTNVELSKDSGSTWQTSQTLTQSGGLVGNTTIQARIPASAIATTAQVSVTGNITSASPGATTQNVSVTGTVKPIPVLTINPTSQTVANNANTSTVIFSSNVAGTTYTWSNNNTSIGIGASGSGAAIASFTATNTGGTPQTGTFTVTPTASGVQGAQKAFTITVNAPDFVPPVISGTPANITNIQATSPAGAAVTYTSPTALDAVDGPRPVTCVLPSGSTFPLGTSTVVCSATDLSGNSASTSFTITVVDTTPPVIVNTPPNIPGVEASSSAGAVVTYTNPTATDIVDGPVSVTSVLASGSTFAFGTNTVICTATDARGNSASTSFTITVMDTLPPTIFNRPANISGIVATGPAGAVVTFSSPTATDVVDGAVPVSCVPPSGSTFLSA